MKRLIYGLILLLAIAHQDFWWWNDHQTLVAGFIPLTLAYHMGISIAAAILWAAAVRYCWPKGLDEADELNGANELSEVNRANEAASPTARTQGGRL